MVNQDFSSPNQGYDELDVGESCPPLSQSDESDIDDSKSDLGCEFDADSFVPETQFEEEILCDIGKVNRSACFDSKRVKKDVKKEKENDVDIYADSFVEETQLDSNEVNNDVKKEKEDDENPFIWSDLYEDSQPNIESDVYDDSFVEETQLDLKIVNKYVEKEKEDDEETKAFIEKVLNIFLPSYRNLSPEAKKMKLEW